jgi:hypothetical protein
MSESARFTARFTTTVFDGDRDCPSHTLTLVRRPLAGQCEISGWEQDDGRSELGLAYAVGSPFDEDPAQIAIYGFDALVEAFNDHLANLRDEDIEFLDSATLEPPTEKTG